MKPHLRVKETLILFSILSGLWGCLPGTQRVAVAPPQKTHEIHAEMLSSEDLDQKINRIEQLLEKGNLNADDMETARELLETYKNVRSLLEGVSSKGELSEIVRMLFSALGRFEEKQLFLQGKKDHDQIEAMNIFSLKRKKIMDLYLYENYQGVIDECLELEAAMGPDALTPDIGFLFSISLAQKGMLKEALNISEKIISDIEERPDAFFLRRSIMEWQLKLGDRQNAFRTYEKLVDMLDERRALLKKAEGWFSEAGITARLPGSSSQTTIPGGDEPDSRKGPLEKLFRDVDKLVLNHEFQRAKILLIRERLRLEEGPAADTIDQALKDVERSEETWSGNKDSAIPSQHEALSLIRKLIAEEKYEEALQNIKGIEKTAGQDAETKKFKELATEKIILRDRNIAAQLFLTARNTKDSEKKAALLTSSYNKLNSLIDNYPSSQLIEKIKDHLKKVKEELIKIEKKPD